MALQRASLALLLLLALALAASQRAGALPSDGLEAEGGPAGRSLLQILCKPGQYYVARLKKCRLCNIGSTSPGGTVTKCTPCPPGFTTGKKGASKCTYCAASFGGPQCMRCVPGTWSPGLPPTKACQPCPCPLPPCKQLASCNATTGGSCAFTNVADGTRCLLPGDVASTCAGGACQPVCVRATCATIGTCGTGLDDGCGGTIDCPAKTCDTAGTCGSAVPDGCGGVLNCPCPTCLRPGGPFTCATINKCGMGLDDGCGTGSTIDCTCPSGYKCELNKCLKDCSPTCGFGLECVGGRCCQTAAASCGAYSLCSPPNWSITGNCGNSYSCPADCGAGSVCNFPYCCKRATCATARSCGSGAIDDGCGGKITCPSCPNRLDKCVSGTCRGDDGACHNNALPAALDISNRGAVDALFNSYFRQYDPSALPAFANDQCLSWTFNSPPGDTATCTPFAAPAGWHAETRTAVNFFRLMVGLAPVDFSAPDKTAKATAAALMFTANSQLSHTPPPSWSCYTAAGAEAAGRSNIAIGSIGWDAVYAYMFDDGSNNLAVGHRRWILYPPTKVMASGDAWPVKNRVESGWQLGNALWILNDDDPSFSNTIKLARPFTSWPPPGYVPYQLVFPRWHFSTAKVDRSGSDIPSSISGATVTMTGPAGAVGLTVVQRGTDFLVWEPAGLSVLNWKAAPPPERTYTVSIGDGQGTVWITYQVTIFTPTGSGGTTAPAAGGLGALAPALGDAGLGAATGGRTVILGDAIVA